MAAPTLFRRLILAQVASACALLVVFGALFYVERNRTVARLTAERWAPALRAVAGLDAPGTTRAPGVRSVLAADGPPADAIRARPWTPRVVMLRATLREEGVAAGEIVFAPGAQGPVTWIAVSAPDGRVRWLGITDDLVESHVVQRLALALALGIGVVGAISWRMARRLARPLETLRRRIEAHDGDPVLPARAAAAPPLRATLELDAIESAWGALTRRLEHQESERALLLAGVSHDLRSPLARIRMAAELLPESDAIAARRASIVRNVDVADRLIDSFLDYVRAAELPLESTVDLAALARRVVDERDRPPAVLAVTAPARLDVPRTHELLLERLLANLVDNALRHGRPPVHVRIEQTGEQARIDVADHGPGIAPAAQARLTQAFARGDASRATPGAGLGLAIVQQIVRRMGGTLSFVADAGAPSVRVTLPARTE